MEDRENPRGVGEVLDEEFTRAAKPFIGDVILEAVPTDNQISVGFKVLTLRQSR